MESLPPMLQQEQDTYYAIRRVRDTIVAPVVRLLAYVRLTPNRLSWGSVLLMVLFALFAEHRTVVSMSILIIVLISDMVDGALARFLKQDSDRGKFIDILCDNITFVLFTLGMVISSFISGFLGITVVYVMSLSTVLRIVHNARFLPSDWLFKPVAGFLPAALRVGFYGMYGLYAVWGLQYVRTATILAVVVLAIDTFRFYQMMVKVPVQKT